MNMKSNFVNLSFIMLYLFEVELCVIMFNELFNLFDDKCEFYFLYFFL